MIVRDFGIVHFVDSHMSFEQPGHDAWDTLSTTEMARWYRIRVGPITPTVPACGAV